MDAGSGPNGTVDSLVRVFRPLRFRGKARLLEMFVPKTGERVAEVFGYRMRLDVADIIQRWIYFGNYEREETYWVKQWLRPGMTVVDVGANCGYYTLLATSCVGPAGRVFAVEPSPHLFSNLLAVVAGNALPNVIPLQAALGSAPGEGLLYPPPDGNNSPSMVRSGDETGLKVTVKTLDDCLQEWGVERVDLLKMDVEGFEPQILAGARSALRSGRIRAILCELNDVWLRRAASSAEALYRSIESHGFVNRFAPPKADRDSFNTCFFVHRNA